MANGSNQQKTAVFTQKRNFALKATDEYCKYISNHINVLDSMVFKCDGCSKIMFMHFVLFVQIVT